LLFFVNAFEKAIEKKVEEKFRFDEIDLAMVQDKVWVHHLMSE